MKSKVCSLFIGKLIFLTALPAGATWLSPLSTRFGAPAINGVSNISSPELGDIVYDTSLGQFMGVGNGLTWVPFGNGTITAVNAGAGLVGGGALGDVTLSVNVGTGADQIVQLDSSGKLPAIDGSQLINVVSTGANLTLSNLAGTTAINSDLIFNKIPALIATTDDVGATGDLALRTGRNIWGGGHKSGKIFVLTGDGGAVNSGSGDATFGSGDGPIGGNGFSGNVTIASGAAGTNTGESGNVIIKTGIAVAGPRGKILIQEGSEGSVGDVWTSTGTLGEGAWAAASSPSGTLCGWSDGALVVQCQGVDPSSSCPAGYTQRQNALSAFFCSKD